MPRLTEYWYPVTTIEKSKERERAIVVTPEEIIFEAIKIGTKLRHQYLVGTAKHETNYAVNECDEEENGFRTYGVYQVSRQECREVGEPDVDLLNLANSTRVFCALMEKRLERIIKEINLDPNNLPLDVWFYLAMIHNMGLGATLKTIKRYGLDAKAWTERNPKLAKNSRYYNNCISGGPDFPIPL